MNAHALELHVPGPDAMRAFGRELASRMRGGEVVLLRGELGAGKTCLAGGVAEGLGIGEPAVSPTYVLHRRYRGSRGTTLEHFDFYRLGGDDDLDALGLEDCLGPDSVVLVEWPERCPSAFEEDEIWLEVAIEVRGEARRVLVRGPGAGSLDEAARERLAEAGVGIARPDEGVGGSGA